MCSRFALHAVLDMMGGSRHACSLTSNLLRCAAAGQVGLVASAACWASAEGMTQLDAVAGVTQLDAVAGVTQLDAWLQALDACQEGLGSCNISPEAPVVVYVSKMVAVPAVALPR